MGSADSSSSLHDFPVTHKHIFSLSQRESLALTAVMQVQEGTEPSIRDLAVSGEELGFVGICCVAFRLQQLEVGSGCVLFQDLALGIVSPVLCVIREESWVLRNHRPLLDPRSPRQEWLRSAWCIVAPIISVMNKA